MDQPQILLAEDEPNIALSLTYILERAGYLVDVTQDGAQVETKAHAMRPDLILLDIMLPNRSGFEILKSLKSAKSTCNLPVMIFSARGQDSDRARAKKLGADDYMIKPYSNSEVLERIEKLIKTPQKS